MVTMREIRAAARAIAKAVHPQRIVLFGSYATGEARKHSDVDLLVLLNGRAVHDRALAIREMVDFPFPVDLLVRSPREFRERVEWGDSFLKKMSRRARCYMKRLTVTARKMDRPSRVLSWSGCVVLD
jgi:uncharacterized protein